ncbi:pseudouridine synthase [Rubricoccus marinus]|uniref:pseudouridine synthase n=1 Tax=Rubricoccus marinus TaxID=716817 RepID=UPI000B982B55|nr:pseudouridine synthase [Rubricoccus marinus]
MAERRRTPAQHTKGRKRASRANRQRPEPQAPASITEEVRLNRFLARAGVASRRGADDIIAERRVRVNGEIVTEMGSKVSPTDRVEVDGRPITPAGLVYILLNKPTDTITTADDEKGRKTVLDLVDLEGGEGDALFPVGRLDRNTTGALLLTTDGDLAHRLMHPRYGANKLYLATTERPVTAPEIEALRAGVELEDGLAKADQVGYVDEDKRKVALALHEGRNRQVRRMLEHLGHEVNALERVGYAGLDLSGLRRGRWRRLQAHEVNMLRRSVKLKAIVF